MTKHLRLGLALTAALAFPARTFAQADVVEYYHLDALGTVRAVTDEAGGVLERHDYLPFGEELCLSGGTYVVCGASPAGQPKRFTGKERDAETGLDYFGARYYRARVGRFTTIDPVYTWQENLVDPQRWNRYAYVRNNPLRYVDPNGKWIETAWDVASIAMGITSLRSNVKEGNWGSALLDGLGVAYDGFAAAIPVLPGGVGAGIKAVRTVRTADRIRDGVRAGEKAGDLSREARKSIRTYEKRIAQHEEKLAEFKAAPTVRPGMEGMSREAIERQQQNRIRHLETEIKAFKGNIEKLKAGGQ